MDAGNAASARCLAAFARRMHDIHPRLGVIASRLQDTPQPQRTSNRSLIIGANEGSTGTRTITAVLRSQGYTVSHGPEHPAVARLLGWTCVRGWWDGPTPRLRGKEAHDAWLGWRPCRRETESQAFERCSSRPPPLHSEAFESVDVALDTPINSVWYDLWLGHPHARVLWMHRPALSWVLRRCPNFRTPSSNGTATRTQCQASVPMPRSCNVAMGELSLAQNVAAYESHATLVGCLVPPTRLLNISLFENRSTEQLWDDLCAAPWMRCRGPRHAQLWSWAALQANASLYAAG